MKFYCSLEKREDARCLIPIQQPVFIRNLNPFSRATAGHVVNSQWPVWKSVPEWAEHEMFGQVASFGFFLLFVSSSISPGAFSCSCYSFGEDLPFFVKTVLRSHRVIAGLGNELKGIWGVGQYMKLMQWVVSSSLC